MSALLTSAIPERDFDHALAGASARCRIGPISVGFVLVTPSTAEAWLAEGARNRRLRPGRVEAYAADMVSGRWYFEASPIKFDHEGALIDGQHRLSALVVADRNIMFLVVCGLAERTMDVVDTGAKRTGGDMFGLHEREHANELAALTRLVLHWRGGQITTTASVLKVAVSNALLAATEAADPRISWAVGEAMAHRHRIGTTTTAIGLFLWLVPAEESERACEFLGAIGEHRSTGVGDPVLAVIRRLNDRLNRNERPKLTTVESTYVLVRGWIAYRANARLDRIPLSRNGQALDFPRLGS